MLGGRNGLAHSNRTCSHWTLWPQRGQRNALDRIRSVGDLGATLFDAAADRGYPHRNEEYCEAAVGIPKRYLEHDDTSAEDSDDNTYRDPKTSWQYPISWVIAIALLYCALCEYAQLDEREHRGSGSWALRPLRCKVPPSRRPQKG